MSEKSWVSHGIWNTAEHALTRGGDTALTLLLIWLLQVEVFSRLVMAQAVAAPLLVLFVSPSWALYHGFARWKKAGAEELGFRVQSLRRLGEAQGQLAIVLAALGAFALDPQLPWTDRWAAMIWALAIAAGPFVVATDRELLRLELAFRPLCLLTFLQKGILLLGTIAVSAAFPGQMWPLAGVAVAALAVSAVIARYGAAKWVRGPRGVSPQAWVRSWLEIFREFSFWNHLSGLILTWLQTMDVFFLGLGGTGARVLGLYGVGLKIANFAMALPQAMGSLLLVWTGRDLATDVRQEGWRVGKAAFGLGAFVLVQNGVLVALAPWILQLMSKGRWSAEEQASMLGWIYWILPGVWCMAVGYLLYIWLQLRASAREVLMRVYAPSLVIGAAGYGASAWRAGADGAARANLWVGVAVLVLLGLEFVRVQRKAPNP